ncbi:PREDICTED: peptidyl-prolyl cis-trans isomerase FKBP62-like isoform X2 [Camelina sativa]|uniref:Peptidyl-prolyl cis-trans isomerase FKBP62-like isoform X2 n=1 Tax=Camelina sativa TaxID=90675 RepID=A0ABM1REW3_CAMSA|nr:PREDICTED: peptidyl-prolyl cis-trans isomerase FKBP62-like isoform X2 [Camelina sativa]
MVRMRNCLSSNQMKVAPPISTVYFEVDLVTYDKERESWDMNTEEKIDADTKKEEENSKFKAGKYALASKRYEKGS